MTVRARTIRLAAVLVTAAASVTGCRQPHQEIRVGDFFTREGTVVLRRPVVYSIKSEQYDYRAIVDGVGGAEPITTGVTNSAPKVYATSGWMYAIGYWPILRGKRVTAAARGTAILVQLNADADRVFLICPTGDQSVDVDPIPGNAKTVNISGGTKYRDVRDDGSIGPEVTVSTDPSDPVRAFLNEAFGKIVEAGLEVPCATGRPIG